MISTMSKAVIAISACVLGLGVMREVVHHSVGIPAALEGLRQLDLNSEHTVPAWWSSTLMFVSALILHAFSKIDEGRGLYHSKIWFPLAVVFFFLSIDEAAGFHESVIDPLRNLLDLDGIFYFAWVIPAFFVLIAFGLIILRPFLALPRPIQVQFAVSGCIFVSGAFGMELVGGYIVASGEATSAAYSTSVIVEEGLEITGLTLFLLSLCRQLDNNAMPAMLALAGGKDRDARHGSVAYHPDLAG